MPYLRIIIAVNLLDFHEDVSCWFREVRSSLVEAVLLRQKNSEKLKEDLEITYHIFYVENTCSRSYMVICRKGTSRVSPVQSSLLF